MALTREEILGRKLGHETVELPTGGTVTVRGLTRDEALEVPKREGTAARDNYVIAAGLVDPVMTEDDVAAWASTGASGDLMAVSQEISRLSGMNDGQTKELTKSVPRGRRKSL